MATALTEGPSDGNDSSHYSKVIELLKLTVKVTILVNGGAAIAVLALIGSILSSRIEFERITYLAWSIGLFGIGVLLGAASIVLYYRSEDAEYEYRDCMKKADDKDKYKSEERKEFLMIAETFSDDRFKWMNFANGLILCSIIVFGVGILLCTLSFFG